jgi:Cu+-exporting ATPase
MSIMVATGNAATQGILFRDAAAIERLRTVDTLIVDKTGTLTEGKPTLERVVPVPGYDEDEVLRIAASIDQGSEHPLAEAVVRAARARGLVLDKPEAFESNSGIGVRGSLSNRPVALGNPALMAELGVRTQPLAEQAERLRAAGASVLFLAVGGKLVGLLAVSDPIKATSADALAALRASGIRVVMATGDALATARAVAARLDIDDVHGELRPADVRAGRAAAARDARSRWRATASTMRRLAQADVGIAMGTGRTCRDAERAGDANMTCAASSGAQDLEQTIANMKQNLASRSSATRRNPACGRRAVSADGWLLARSLRWKMFRARPGDR